MLQADVLTIKITFKKHSYSLLTKLNLTGHFLSGDSSKHTNRTALKLLANETHLKGYPEEMPNNMTPATGYKTNVQTSLLLLVFSSWF